MLGARHLPARAALLRAGAPSPPRQSPGCPPATLPTYSFRWLLWRAGAVVSFPRPSPSPPHHFPPPTPPAGPLPSPPPPTPAPAARAPGGRGPGSTLPPPRLLLPARPPRAPGGRRRPARGALLFWVLCVINVGPPHSNQAHYKFLRARGRKSCAPPSPHSFTSYLSRCFFNSPPPPPPPPPIPALQPGF